MRFKIAPIAAGATFAALLVAAPAPALANGVGDLYLASPAGVLEVHVSTATVVSKIEMPQPPQSLAFTPDGKTLYVGSGGARVTPIDIETLALGSDIATPGPVSALAFPAGQILVGAMPQRRSLVFITVHGNEIAESAELPGPGNLLAGDRRDPRIAVAEAGGNWLEVIDPATQQARKTTLAGLIQALAVDRTGGDLLVATSEPDALLKIDLTTLVVARTMNLPGIPSSVVAMPEAAVVSGGTNLWYVTDEGAVPFATTRDRVVGLAASDEGKFVHVAEPAAVEVFDRSGKLQRTLELGKDRSPVALAAVPAGSSLYMGTGSNTTPRPASAAGTPGALATPKTPPTGTFVETATNVISYPPVQGALAVAIVILGLYWLVVRWYDKRSRDAG
jgi:DNA-binding beta-propeller fold protein YncE